MLARFRLSLDDEQAVMMQDQAAGADPARAAAWDAGEPSCREGLGRLVAGAVSMTRRGTRRVPGGL